MDEFRVNDTTQLEEGNESNAALLQLQDAFVSALTASGTLGKIRAQLRATALALIRGDEDLQDAAVGPFMRPRTLTAPAKVSLLLLYDFLQHHHLQQTAGVLDVESGVHLLFHERSTLLGSLIELPGDGSLLERLVQSYEIGIPVAGPRSSNAPAAPPRTPLTASLVAAEAGASRYSFSSSSVAGEEAAAAAQPGDPDVEYELDRYEDSIPFSDTEGTIDASMQCNEVERLVE
ncbi:hypothetical protein LSCM1_02480 [Leishmania martiniquensis]|uniref:LisH domain-containing protein n=1 Tax=Leishmania martiniquensis TaxID=1580590 RepID=A0A836KFV9_9TRYP|nr:hypothetical protein LSCM1_02480 [Leishmania martiniquensis]